MHGKCSLLLLEYAFSGAPSALWRPICLLAPIRLSAPPSHWQPKGTSAREVTLVLWRAYQQFVKWHPILFPRGRMWLNPRQHFSWPLKKDGSSSFLNCHLEDSFGYSCQFSEFWSEKAQILTEKWGFDMAWRWIRISLESRMVSWYKNEIKRAGVSNCMRQCLNFLVLNVHIPAYLGSREKPFFRNFKFFRYVCLS